MKFFTPVLAVLLFTSAVALGQQAMPRGDDRSPASIADTSRSSRVSAPGEGDDDLKVELEALKGQVGGIDETMKEMQSTVDALKKIKVSGYLQVNFEKSESVKGFAADPYDAKDVVTSRFRLRRSRVKVTYDGGSTQMVVQGDFSNSGFTLKDAYLEFAEQWLKLASLRFGVFNRPAYEVEYSSSQRESPERSQVIRSLYPDERDLGAMLTVTPEDLFTLQIAAFNSTFQGTFKQQNPNFREFPVYFMARVRKSLNLGDLGLDLGVHGRFGSIRTNTVKSIESDMPSKGIADSTSRALGDGISRTWFGVEAQLYYDLLGGMKILGEYIVGSDVNELSANGSTAARLRDFAGFYVMLVKNLGTEFQFAVKYDAFDPNTAISADKVDDAKELQISTLGFGLHNYTFPNVRLTLWYDMVSTKTNDRILTADPKDNLLTFRAQYKF